MQNRTKLSDDDGLDRYTRFFEWGCICFHLKDKVTHTERQGADRDLPASGSLPQICCNGRSWADRKSGAKSFFRISHMGVGMRAKGHLLISEAHWQWLVLLWTASVLGSRWLDLLHRSAAPIYEILRSDCYLCFISEFLREKKRSEFFGGKKKGGRERI